MGNILDLKNMWSMSQLCYCNMKTAKNNTKTNGSVCVSIKLYLQKYLQLLYPEFSAETLSNGKQITKRKNKQKFFIMPTSCIHRRYPGENEQKLLLVCVNRPSHLVEEINKLIIINWWWDKSPWEGIYENWVPFGWSFFKQIEGVWRKFPLVFAVLQVPSAQNNQYTKVAYSVVASPNSGGSDSKESACN